MKKNKLSLDDAIKEIKSLAKDFRSRNGNSSLRIPNKDMNLWMINQFIKQNGRIGKLESTTKILLMLFCGLMVKVIVF